MNRFYPRDDVEKYILPHIKFFKEGIVTTEKKQRLQQNVNYMHEVVDNLCNGVVELFERLEEVSQFLLFYDMLGTHEISHHGFQCKQLIIDVNGDRWGIILGKRQGKDPAYKLKYFISLAKDAEEQRRLPGTPNGVRLSDDPDETSLNSKILQLEKDIYKIEVDKTTIGDIQSILLDAKVIREQLDLASDVISRAIQYCNNELVKLTKAYDDLLTTSRWLPT